MKRALLCGASAAAVTVVAGLWGSAAVAQTTAAPAAQPVAQPPTTENRADVIVTAGKRTASIQKVPVAVSAFTAKQRDLLGIKTVQDLSDFTPGLSYYSVADRAYIRGVGRNTVNLATDSAVATYYNGVYYGANASIALSHDSLFISQIEVNRGPQNVLHGSNADGGTINYISQRPTKTFAAEGRFGIGDYGYYYGEAAVSGPIDDHLRFRFGANYSSQSGGFFKNLIGTDEGGVLPQGNNGNSNYIEGQLQGTWDRLDGWAMASSGNYHTSFHTVSTVGNLNDYEFPNGALAPSGWFALCATQPSNIGCLGLPGIGQDTLIPTSVQGPGVLASAFSGNNPTNLNIHHFIETSVQSNNQTNDLALATQWTYHFDGADLQYIGGYQQFYYDLFFGPGVDSGVTQYQVQGAPNAVAAGPCVASGNTLAACEAPLTINPGATGTSFIEDEQYFSNEVNLISTHTGPVQWIAGLYWYHQHYNQPVGLGCEANQSQLVHPLGPANPGGCVITLDGNMTYDSYATYAQGTWQIDPAWKLEGALRYTWDHKSGHEEFGAYVFDTGFIPGIPTAGVFGSATPGINASAGFAASAFTTRYPGAGLASLNPNNMRVDRNLSGDWGALTGEATLTWTPDEHTLAYLKYSRGYKSGGFNAGPVAPNPEIQPEFVNNYEAGLKLTYHTIQFNAAAFYEDYYDDQQPLQVLLAPGAPTSAQIRNIPEAAIYGLELEAVWHPIDPLVITAEYSYLNAKVTNSGGLCFENTNDSLAILANANTSGCHQTGHAGDPILQTLKGRTLPETPPNKFAINGLYTFRFDPGNLTLSASYIWKDKTYGTIWNTAQDLAPSYSTVNIRAQWDDVNNRYTVSAYVNNLFNSNGWDNFSETQFAPNTSFGVPYDVVTAKGLTNPLFFGAEVQLRFR